MVRLRNTTSWKSVDDMLEAKYAGDFVGIKNDRPVIINRDEALIRLSNIEVMNNCLNSCASPFIIPYGLVGESETITIDPMTIGNITLKTPLTKSLRGLFQEGNNNGCKDESYGKWEQPLMESPSNNLGECLQINGTVVNQAWKAMNGIFNAKDDGWKSQGAVTTWQFKSVNPFILQSIVFTNTDDDYKSKLLTVRTDRDVLRRDYYMNVDNLGKSYLDIEEKNRKESNTLNIDSTNYNNKGGFNEVEINALTKYVQQDSEYYVFLIKGGEKVDLLLSYNDEPILPEGFTEYEYVKSIRTAKDKIALVATYGDKIQFNTDEMPVTITKDGVTKSFRGIDTLTIDNNDVGKYYIYLKMDETAYYSNEETDDIKVGEIFVKNHNIVSLTQYPCNYNGQYAYTNATLKLFEEDAVSNYTYQIEHGLSDTSNYTVDAYLKCFKADNGYVKGDIYHYPSLLQSSLTDTFIIMETDDLKTINKFNGQEKLLGEHCWKIVFRLVR